MKASIFCSSIFRKDPTEAAAPGLLAADGSSKTWQPRGSAAEGPLDQLDSSISVVDLAGSRMKMSKDSGSSRFQGKQAVKVNLPLCVLTPWASDFGLAKLFDNSCVIRPTSQFFDP